MSTALFINQTEVTETNYQLDVYQYTTPFSRLPSDTMMWYGACGIDINDHLSEDVTGLSAQRIVEYFIVSQSAPTGSYDSTYPTVTSLTGNLLNYDSDNSGIVVEYQWRPTLILSATDGDIFVKVRGIDGDISQLSGIITTTTPATYSITGNLDLTTKEYDITFPPEINAGYWSTDNPFGDPVPARFVALSSVSVSGEYHINYGTYNWGTTCAAITSERLIIDLTNTTNRYSITANALGDYSPGQTMLFPRINTIIEKDVFVDYTDLQLVRVGSTTYLLSSIGEQEITWSVSDPLTATIQAGLCAGITIEISTLSTLPVFRGTSMYDSPSYWGGDWVTFTSDYSSTKQYTITAELPNKTIKPIYTFNYDPFVSETLNIALISATEYSVWLRPKRLVYGMSNIYDGTFPLPVLSTYSWNITPTTPTPSAYFGLTGIDVDFPYNPYELAPTINIASYGSQYSLTSAFRPGLSLSEPLCTVYGILCAYKNTISPEILQINFDPASAITYTICAINTTNLAISDTYEFLPNLPTNVVVLSSMFVDLEPRVAILDIKGINQLSPGVYTKINDNDILTWDCVQVSGVAASIWATYPTGTPYTLRTPIFAPQGSEMMFYISSHNSETQTSKIPYQLSLTALSLTAVSLTYLTVISALETFDINYWPYPEMDPSFRINYENPRLVNENMWRLLADNSVTAYDTSYLTISGALPTESYKRIWNWGDGTTDISAVSAITHTYTTPVLTAYTITFGISDFNYSADPLNITGPFSTSCVDIMRVNYVPRFLSGVFIGYPTISFPTSSTEDVRYIDSTNYTTSSQGICAYGEGHTETFTFSAAESTTIVLDGNTYPTTYRWRFDNLTKSGKTMTLDIPSNIGTNDIAGSSVALDVFNDVFPMNTMVSAHTADSGLVEIYPNFGIGANIYAYTQASNTDKTFQTIRMMGYEQPSASIYGVSSIMIVPTEGTINGDANIYFPSYSPITMNSVGSTFTWTLSTNRWYIPKNVPVINNPLMSYTFLLGDGLVPGTVRRNECTEVLLSLSGIVYGILDFPPNDWQASPKTLPTTTFSTILSVYTEPQITFYVERQVVLTGENVTFENTTPQTPTNFITGFIWDGGNGIVSAISGFGDFNNIYYNAGIYDISVSAIAFDGTVFSEVFPNTIIVVNNYEPFDSDIFRIYQTTQLSLPYTLEEVKMPPNEWGVADTINACFNKLLDNQTYLTEACKIYNPPPANYYGWLGTAVDNDPVSPLCGTDVFGWRTMVHNTSAAQRTDLIIDDASHFTNVKDVVFKNTWFYIANGSKLEIRADDSDATLIDSRSYKGIGDNFIRLDSVQVDSRDRIYVLDSPKNRVVVFEYDYYATDKWTILYSWGGLGGATAKTKFQGPTQLLVDDQDSIWIVDSGNGVIKNYSSTGSWINTISSDHFNNTSNKPLSVAVDSDRNLHILTSNGSVVKIDRYGNHITIYYYASIDSSLPRRIIKSDDTGFLYVVQSNCLCKVRNSGQNAGLFGQILGTANYMGGYQDADKNLLVCNTNSIIKFNDRLQILDTLRDTTGKMWTTNDILIEKEEYINDIVYSRSLSRLYDNIEILRRSIRGKIVTRTTDSGETIISLRGYTPSEYALASDVVPKADVLIGVNELVTADVINRCLIQLYSVQEKALNLIS